LKNYYSILGINQSATIDEIKKAYRRKAKEYHPDVSVLPNAKDLFIQATEAYEYLLRVKLLAQAQMEAEPEKYREEWVRYERPKAGQRAERFSGMRYKDFTKTKYYKATRVANEIYLYLTIALGTIIVMSDFFSFMNQIKDPSSTYASYINDFFMLILGIVFIFFGLFQLLDLKMGKESK
jgi:curved DNA-binding protein CbpA